MNIWEVLPAMLDADLAVLYGVETKALLQAVKRNPARFEDFVFQTWRTDALKRPEIPPEHNPGKSREA